MSNLPEVFVRHNEDEEAAITVYPFSFSEHDNVFRIGGVDVQTEQFDPYSFNPYLINLNDGLAYSEIPKYPVTIPVMGGLLIGPGLHDWALENQADITSAIPVMKRVFTDLHPSWDDDGDDDLPEGGGHIGFDVRLQKEGGLIFQVLGNCACFGPDPYSYIINGQFEHGYAQYTLHNNDYDFQRTAVYAGVGHLAFLAGNESPRQQQLF